MNNGTESRSSGTLPANRLRVQCVLAEGIAPICSRWGSMTVHAPIHGPSGRSSRDSELWLRNIGSLNQGASQRARRVLDYPRPACPLP